MTLSLDEQLSRYLEGDLSPGEVAAIEARIASSPEVAAALEDLRTLREALRELPTTVPPPPLRARSRRIPWGWGGAGLAMAAMLWLLLRPGAPRTVVLASGASELSGELRVVAGDVSIELDGRARIVVEPPSGVLRPARSKEDDPMNLRMPLAALAGATVTLLVVEGRALVSEGDGAPVVQLEPGPAQTFGHRSTAVFPAAPIERATALKAEIAALQDELVATQRELEASALGRDLAQGQLAGLRGTESRWPDDVPDAMLPQAFEAGVRERVAEVEGIEMDRVDCDEFPCVAVLRLDADAEFRDGDPSLEQAVQDWVGSVYGEDHSLSFNSMRFRHNDHEGRFVLFAAHGGDGDDNVGVRTEYRMDTLGKTLSEEVSAEAERVEGTNPDGG